MRPINIQCQGLRFLLVAVASLIIVSCTKPGTINNTNPGNKSVTGPTPPKPTVAGASGVLTALRIKSTEITPFLSADIIIGTAAASFTKTPGDFATPADAGTVKANGTELVKQTGNTYTFTPAATYPQGIVYGNDAVWSVAGSADVPAISYTHGKFPSNPNITNAQTVLTRANGFSITIGQDIVNADSVYYIVYGGSASKLVSKVVAPGVNTVNFTASELAGLGTGTGFIQVAPYAVASSAIGGNTYYFINETVDTKQVTVK